MILGGLIQLNIHCGSRIDFSSGNYVEILVVSIDWSSSLTLALNPLEI